MDSQPRHHLPSARACQVGQIAAHPAPPVPSVITAQLAAHVSATVSPEAAIALSSTVEAHDVATATTIPPAVPQVKKTTYPQVPDVKVSSFADDETHHHVEKKKKGKKRKELKDKCRRSIRYPATYLLASPVCTVKLQRASQIHARMHKSNSAPSWFPGALRHDSRLHGPCSFAIFVVSVSHTNLSRSQPHFSPSTQKVRSAGMVGKGRG